MGRRAPVTQVEGHSTHSVINHPKLIEKYSHNNKIMSQKMMKALLKEDPKEGYVLKEIPIPEPKSDEILFKVEKVGICGSDTALYAWNEVARTIATVPFIPGHEAAGVVTAVGSDVKCLSVGSRVAIENHFFCENCYTCEEGRGDICAKMDQYGHGKGTTQGGFSEYSL